jgi:hypothetical protein
MQDWISKEFLIAICISLAIALVSVILVPPYHPPQTQQAESGQKANNSLETQNDSKDAKNRNDDASEYWTILGRRLKITDTLLVLFTFTLWWATRKLVIGSEDAAKRQLRSYVFLGYSPLEFCDKRATFTLKMSNVGKMPGFIKEVGYAFVVRDSLPKRRRDADWTWKALEWDLAIPADGKQDITPLQSEAGEHFFIAYIQYQDIFAKQTHTSWMGMHIRPDAAPEERTARAGGDIWNDWD